MALACTTLASTIACQSLDLYPSSASLFSNTNPTKGFFAKKRISVSKCRRLSFNIYASASESEVSHIEAVPTLYDILGINQDVGVLEIKSAFRQLALQHHPDLCTAADAAEATTRFIKVKEAYQTLSDAQLKSEYDEQLRNPQWANFAFAKAKKGTPTRWQTASSHVYRAQWRDQLSGLTQKVQPVCRQVHISGGSSWGARMRQRMELMDSSVKS
ncbi:hypothetical protein O6H91_04G071100 [Diphasiastrum complanatum]|uniref:Uncharacterized protein n=1 Tax=Diphasiastrum complanatum TaxID=34168 RepID=A0ACC2DY05_DIPCM|nr:hypothetical protein O6H91_04G071100 [Diphasiastrum complanatum]